MMHAEPADARRHEPFRFRTAEALRAAAEALGVELPWAADCAPLLQPMTVGPLVAPNRLVVQPMEACDALPDGAPGEWTVERYRRFAAGGSGLIWFEATAIEPEGRSSPAQLLLSRRTLPAFARLVDTARGAARSALGANHRPLLVLQITHSGRYAHRAPLQARRVACPNPHLDKPGWRIEPWRDEELDGLVDRFVDAIALGQEAGFDAIDVKACHGYLVHELLTAHTRDSSRFGGPFENRTRFLMAVMARAKRAGLHLPIAVRMNATDGVPFPYGFGTSPDGSGAVDLDEPRALAVQLAAAGCALLNVTAGIPAHNSHIGRPYDRAAGGGAAPPEHPLIGVGRLIGFARELQIAVPSLPTVGTGYSWLRQFWPQVGAGAIGQGWSAAVGVGRGAFAYPDASLDLMRHGRLDPQKCCVSCSYCSELKRAGAPTGCVVRHRERYHAPVRASRAKAQS